MEDLDELQFVELLKTAAIQTQNNNSAWFLDS